MHIPLAFGLVGGNGADVDYEAEDCVSVSNGVIHLTKRRQTFVLNGVATEPLLSINRGFSAPITIVADDGAARQRFDREFDILVTEKRLHERIRGFLNRKSAAR